MVYMPNAVIGKDRSLPGHFIDHQSWRKQFKSGQAITKGGGGSGGPPPENFEKNAACWRILVIF